MIGRLLGVLGTLIGAACVATILSAAILGYYYGQKWQVNRERVARALAVVRGAEPAPQASAAVPAAKEASTEQASYSQFLEARAAKTRDVELREQALRNNLVQIQADRERLTEEKNKVQKLRTEFQDELASLTQGAASAGRDDVRRTLETLKPKQAKELVTQMLEKSEMDEVVLMLSGMTESRRAKILGEFKTATETEQIGEVLRRIRQGNPAAAKVDDAKKHLEPPKGPE